MIKKQKIKNKLEILKKKIRVKKYNLTNPKINIVTEREDEGWVLRMMAQRWASYLPNCTISERKPDINADINFYVYWDFYKEPTNIDIGWFTHREFDSRRAKKFNRKARRMDYCICPSHKTYKLLPKYKSFILKHGIGLEYKNMKNEITFGIVGREYDTGRKRFNLVENHLKKIPNTKFLFTNAKISTEKMPDFYNQIDYLLVLSNNEGGPVPVLESIAMGKPVIAPNVGWCWEYPVIKYTDINNLIKTISMLSSQVNIDKVWEDSSKNLLEIFKSI